MSFTNLYYKRTTATPKACYVCYKPTTTVLATLNTTDFLYTCSTHLTDPGFATQVGESGDGAGGTRKTGLSPEEIAKIKEEWEERQKKKKDKKDAAKDIPDDKEKGKGKDEGKNQPEQPAKVPGALSPPAITPPPETPKHERYTLHRDIFALRLDDLRRRRQAVAAKELAPRLPGAPRSPLPRS